MLELAMSLVIMLAMFYLASVACGPELLRETDERLTRNKAA
jgi:hypothetical protein